MLPAELKVILEQVAASPRPIRSITVPTAQGPFTVEFEAGQIQRPQAAATPTPGQSTSRPAAPKVRDLELLKKQDADPPRFQYEVADAAG